MAKWVEYDEGGHTCYRKVDYGIELRIVPEVKNGELVHWLHAHLFRPVIGDNGLQSPQPIMNVFSRFFLYKTPSQMKTIGGIVQRDIITQAIHELKEGWYVRIG